MGDGGTNLSLDLKSCFFEIHLPDGVQSECPVAGEDVGHINTVHPFEQCIHQTIVPEVKASQGTTLVLVKSMPMT